MNCPAVRDRLPEHALGVVDHHDATAIERHLAWCAACRKEARDLERAAATMAFALAPASPSVELGERVIGAVRRVSAPAPAPAPARRGGRRVGVVFIAAALVFAGLGVGAVLGHRDPPSDPQTRGAQQEDALSKFGRAITGALQAAAAADPGIQAQIGQLAPVGSVDASGAGLSLESPTADDQVVVWLTGLARKRAPYLVFLTDGRGNAFEVARISTLDRDGGAMKASVVGRNLARYERMIVRDATGKIVLSGTLAPVTTTG